MALGYQNSFYLKQAQQKQQSLYNGTLLENHDPPAVYDSEETLELAQESRLKMKQLNKEIKPTNYTKFNHLSGVFVSQTAKSREELYFSNTSKMTNVSKSISILNEEFSYDTTPSVARKFLNEVKSTIVTLQQAAKFVRDFKSLAKEADESLDKHKALELEIERLLRAVVNQDIMSIVQNPSVKCKECKYDKISYDKDYNDMQQKIERLQAQLGDQKGKSKDTPCVLDTLDPLSQKLENENVELEYQGLPKIDESHALSKPVSSNSAPSSRESNVMNNEKVIALEIFRINPFKASRAMDISLMEKNKAKMDKSEHEIRRVQEIKDKGWCGHGLREGFCLFCASRDDNSSIDAPNPNSFNDPLNVFTHPPQPQYETYSCELCGNDSHYGYDCPPRFPLVYEQESCYNQNFGDNYYPQNSPSFPQQYLNCEKCGGPHEDYQCQPWHQNYSELNPCYDSNSYGFDQPSQYSIDHQPQEDLNQQSMDDVYNK
ncbi:hypothetical protein Tco_1004268 [Tanacetum coccineum]|uniref:CCHC-type domain-containing protein n=1 Tax=Tanacetum coccineum TaxID=301880 RepID=A0ABQ5FCQ9_9ASTR